MNTIILVLNKKLENEGIVEMLYKRTRTVVFPPDKSIEPPTNSRISSGLYPR